MNLLAILAIVGLGLLTGLFSGMFGIGGGAVITPGLLAIFSLLKVPEGVLTHLAVGTSLTYIFIVSSVTFFFYARFGVGMTRERLLLFLSALVGGLLGSILALISPSGLLRALLGFVELGVGVQMFLVGSLHRHYSSSSYEGKEPRKASGFILGILGIACGMLSPLTGVGGGVLAVPAMVLWLRVPYGQAAANGAFMVIGTSFLSAIFFILGGFFRRKEVFQGVDLLSWTSMGFVSPLALWCLLPFGILGSFLGSRLAMTESPTKMQGLLAGVLLIIGLWVLMPVFF